MATGDRSTFDELARDLETLRIESGAISYAEIVARIVDRRLAAGAAPGSAQIARSTVYDVFRPGRSRVNPDLVEEIVTALGLTESESLQWRQRYVDARVGQRPPHSLTPELPLVAAPALGPTPTIAPGEPASPLRNPAIIAMFIFACVGLNNIGAQFVMALDVPLYLDMAGTAVAAVIFGPWYGVLVALVHHGTAAWIEGQTSQLWFTLVNVTGALVWGYGVHRWRMGRTAFRFFLLNLLAGVACSIVAVPVLMAVFGGIWLHPTQTVLVPVLRADGMGLLESVLSVNLLLSLTDKLFSGCVALAIAYGLLRWGMAAPSELTFGPFQPGYCTSRATAPVRSRYRLRRVDATGVHSPEPTQDALGQELQDVIRDADRDRDGSSRVVDV